MVPIAAFEIEGSTTTSKNQMGNLLNLALLNPFLSFVIVNNEKASNEKDTYRRGVKIIRTYMEFSNKQNIILLDWSYLKDVEKSLESRRTEKRYPEHSSNIVKRSKVGGENDTLLMENLIKLLQTTKLKIHQNYTSPVFEWHYYRIKQYQNIDASETYDYHLHKKYIFRPNNNIEKRISKKNKFYYLPQVDFALELNIPLSFKLFLLEISKKLNKQNMYYPILYYLENNPQYDLSYPFIGIEVENTINKHLNGGVFNMSNFFYIGLLVSNETGKHHIETLKTLGINNVFHLNEKVIKELKL